MSEDLRGLHDALTADLGDGGDQGDTTPAAAPETPAATTEGQDSGNQGATPPAGDEPEALLSDEERKANPWLAEREKQMQAAMTRATQRAAEQAKAYEGIDPTEADWVRQFKQAQQFNPALARQMAEQLAQQFATESASASSAAPEFEWASDGERLLWERQQRQDQFIQEMRLDQQRQEAERQFAALERDFGAISPQQRYQVVERMTQLSHPEKPIPLSMIPEFYRGMFGYQQALTRGRNEAASVVAVKNGIGPPPGGVTPHPQEEELDPGKMSLNDSVSAKLVFILWSRGRDCPMSALVWAVARSESAKRIWRTGWKIA